MVMVKSAIKKSRRKSQREAARIQKQTDAALAMEEDEEILFKRPKTVPNTPRASRTNTPDPDDCEEEPRDYTAVLQMVKTVRDQLTALVLDNTNIRAACDDLRRQCHSQGVAFGDLSRLVSQTREDQEETRAYSHGETGPHPRIRQELLDAGGNLRARDIGISWQDGEDLSAWCPDNGTEGRHGGQPYTTGDGSTIPAVSRGAGGRPSPTGDVNTVPTEPRASAEWHVDAWISTSGVHRDVRHTNTPLRGTSPGRTSRP